MDDNISLYTVPVYLRVMMAVMCDVYVGLRTALVEDDISLYTVPEWWL